MKNVINTGVIHPEGCIYFLKESEAGLIRITVSKRTLQVVNEELLDGVPDGWTEKDVTDLVDEGNRFFGN